MTRRLLLVVSLLSAAALAASISGSVAAKEVSTKCAFNKGPLAGHVVDYAPMAAIAVGSPCHDGASTGKVVPMGVIMGAVLPKSTLCHFTAGPKAGTTVDYAPQKPLPVGMSCHDGASTGVVVKK